MFKKTGKKWFGRYLPFVVRPTELQLQWLTAALARQSLTTEEISPYIKILLTDNEAEDEKELTRLLLDIDGGMISRLLEATDIYDIPLLFKLIPSPTFHNAEIALQKEVPPFERQAQMVYDQVFYAINNRSEKILVDAAESLLKGREVPENFKENFQRFRRILDDKEFLLSLYPKARG